MPELYIQNRSPNNQMLDISVSLLDHVVRRNLEIAPGTQARISDIDAKAIDIIEEHFERYAIDHSREPVEGLAIVDMPKVANAKGK